MTRFTPGPWRVFYNNGVGPNRGSQICQPDGPSPEEAAANARLIAAAPDLLAAIKEVVAIADRKTDEFDRARAAIAKAEGRS